MRNYDFFEKVIVLIKENYTYRRGILKQKGKRRSPQKPKGTKPQPKANQPNYKGNMITERLGREVPFLARRSASELALRRRWEKVTCRLLARSKISSTTAASFQGAFRKL